MRFLQTEGKSLHQQKDQDLLYCHGLEPNPQYLQRLPVLSNAMEFLPLSTSPMHPIPQTVSS